VHANGNAHPNGNGQGNGTGPEAREIWWTTVHAVETALEEKDARVAARLLGDLKLLARDLVPDPEARLRGLQSLERSERCAELGHLSLARTELKYALTEFG
jgi:hypothetical protein